MSVNTSLPHVLVLPEDDANRELANGFHLDVGLPRSLQVLQSAGGWMKVLERFASDHLGGMNRYPQRTMVLLIDLDRKLKRMQDVKDRIPHHLANRVFVLSTLSKPEELKRGLGPYEEIGRKLAEDCRNGTNRTWSDRLLQHNADELKRLNACVRPILFPSA